ncbi:flagellar hook capping FlgD N-terminal domain-containing protein [uncultured Clostridium sp.]|uniref:flagellar hook assembly protein FlgD n=1 Tax=uncultured Clostridium sp. TaxID=59620 RepID=UPI0028E512E1|nr:flagellar hook capping FlgD N-terminal domain-containing protein [uncultured Clostridium sp.]
MAIDGTVTGSGNVITGQEAKYQAAANKKAQTVGQQTTDRGTLITKSNNEMNKDSFLRILVAEMGHQDPTQNQDPTVMVTQMAQLTSMEQMSNLNDTMTTNAYEGLVGKGVTVDVADNNGDDYTGIVRGASKQDNTWYLTLEVNENGKSTFKVFQASKLKSVLDSSDYTNRNMLINSDFMAASSLASDKNNKVIILTSDDKGNNSLVKGTVKSAYLDNGVVKIRVATFDSNGNESTTTTDYGYSNVVKAGDLTESDMNVKVEDYVGTSTSNNDPTTQKDPSDPTYDHAAQYDKLNNSTTEVKGSSSKMDSSASANSMQEQYEKANEVYNN